jgi:hypothetical protein
MSHAQQCQHRPQESALWFSENIGGNKMSYLKHALPKQKYSTVSVADQLEAAKKNGGSRALIEFLEAERAAEIAAEQKTAARVKELEGVLQADAIESEKLRIRGILTLPETDENEQRLLSYCEKLSDKPAMHSASAEEWRVLVLSILPNVSILFAGQNIAPLTQEELEKFILPYMVTNGIFVGDSAGRGTGRSA